MEYQLLHNALHIRAFSEACNTRRPHHDTHRNDEYGCIHHALRTVDALGNRQSQETGIGNDGAVLHNTLQFLRYMVIKQLAEHIAHKLNNQGDA